MAYSNKQIELTKKVYYSRMRILSNHPFFGMLMLDIKFSLKEEENSFSTDGTTIYFNPKYLDSLNEEELDICILHSIMHIVLKHPFRENNFANKELYNLACDIVVNSNLLYSIGGLSNKKELIVQGQILPHRTPIGDEGYKHSTLEVYNMLMEGRVEKPKFDEIPLVQFISNKTGKIYLKELSVQKYYKNGDWKNLPLLDKQYSKHPFTYTFNKIKNASYPLGEVEVQTLFDMEVMPYPCYSSTYNSRKTDCYLEGRPRIKTPIKVEYFFKPTTKQLLLDLKKTSFNDEVKEKEEGEYAKFVYDNYLGITKELEEFLSQIIKINNFSKDDEDIIFKVCNYIKRAARYDLEFIEVPEGKDYIIHFLTETKIGLCRHFAAAATMLYRALGIPSRYTVGFSGKTKQGTVCYVSDKDAHAWVEVYVDKVGWIIVDPTPSSNSNESDDSSSEDEENIESSSLDGHISWSEANGKKNRREQEINKRIIDAQELHKNYQKSVGKTPANVPSSITKLTKPQLDWRVYLQSFIQENIIDYSFCPPDRRFSEGDFILPSFSEPDEEVKDILFMVDVSGSMSDKDIITCFSEIQSAITQFNGKLQGKVGFFDAKVQGVEDFDGETDIRDIKPKGRGGTDFKEVFNYIGNEMKNNLPVSIIILSDGYCDFPNEEDALGIPVLWVINNEEVTPPWGNVTRIGVGEEI